MKLKSLYIHTGFHKTGTSSIQDYCAQHSHDLMKVGLYYPVFTSFLTKDKIINHSEVIYSLFSESWESYHVNLRYNTSKENLIRLNEEYRFELQQNLIKCPTEKMLLSGEDISSLSRDELISFTDYIFQTIPDVKVKFITYVRNPFNYFVSEIQQTIKGGVDIEQSLNYRLRQLTSLYKPTIESLIAIPGTKTDLYKYEDTKNYNGGAVGHILDVLLPSLSYSTNISYANEVNTSISLEAALILSEINRIAPLFVDGKLNPLRKYEDFLVFLKIGGTKFSVPQSIAEQAKENASEVLLYLDKNHGIKFTHESTNFQTPTWPEEIHNELSLLITENFPHFKEPIVNFLKDCYILSDSLSVKKNLLQIIQKIEPTSLIFDESKLTRKFL